MILTVISKDTQKGNLITIQTLPRSKQCCLETTDASKAYFHLLVSFSGSQIKYLIFIPNMFFKQKHANRKINEEKLYIKRKRSR